MVGFWILFFMAGLAAFVTGLKMKPEAFDPSEPFSGLRVTSRAGLIAMGIFCMLIAALVLTVSLLKSSGRIG